MGEAFLLLAGMLIDLPCADLRQAVRVVLSCSEDCFALVLPNSALFPDVSFCVNHRPLHKDVSLRKSESLN